jgi:MFS transporter, DHA2 family, multidrug resistance protein
MRQLGGSFGVAAITTYLSRQNMVHRNYLVGKLDVNDYNVQQRIKALQQNFIAHGKTPDVALKNAYQVLEGMVMKQASVLSYMDVFFYLGMMFLICIPFILFVRQSKKKKIDLAEAMH